MPSGLFFHFLSLDLVCFCTMWIAFGACALHETLKSANVFFVFLLFCVMYRWLCWYYETYEPYCSIPIRTLSWKILWALYVPKLVFVHYFLHESFVFCVMYRLIEHVCVFLSVMHRRVTMLILWEIIWHSNWDTLSSTKPILEIGMNEFSRGGGKSTKI